MCGILGFYFNNKINYSNHEFNLNLKNLEKRGPDNTNSCEFNFQDRKIFLGHTRLSILDISNLGNQAAN